MTLNKLTSDALADNTIDNDSIANNSIPIEKLSNVNLAIAPEVLTIDVAAPAAGQDIQWLWNWLTSSLPYARRAITNSNELNVPLYKQGTYTVNNFAKTQYGSMTQAHTMYFKWIEGAGTQNNISWVTDQGTFTDSHPDINGGSDTTVQRLSISVPSTVTPPTLTAPSVTYGVSFVNTGAYTFSGPRDGDNPNIGPLRRGGTYTFNVSASGHPFYLTTDNGTNFSAGTYFGEYTSGVTNSRTASGTMTFVVPANAPDTLYYQCGNHSAMRGAITIKDLAVETNINGNYVVYAQHTQEGHKTPVELRPIPSLVNQMCIVYDAATGQFVPQDLATYVENTPSFENKIREVAGTAELVVEDGSAVVAKVNVYADSTYLPLTDNNAGDQAFATDTNKLYIWDGSAWQLAGAANTGELAEGTNLYYTDARADARAQLKIDALVDSSPSTLDTLNELAAALGDDANFSTTVTNSIATKLSLSGGTMTGDLSFGDNDKAIFGAGSDLQIYHDGSNSYIDDAGTGELLIRGRDAIVLEDITSGDNYIYMQRNNKVELYYSGASKLATTATGVDVTGTITATNFSGDGSSITNVNADTLDGINSTSFLRSDTNNTFTGNQLKLENSFPSAGGLLLVSDDGTATTVSSGTAFRVTNNGGNGSYSVFESSSGVSDLVHYNNGVLEMSNSSGAAILRLTAPGNEISRIELGDGSNYGHISTRPDMGDGILFYENGSNRAMLRGGNFGIGTINPVDRLHIYGNEGNSTMGIVLQDDGWGAPNGQYKLTVRNSDGAFAIRKNTSNNFDFATSDDHLVLTSSSGKGKLGINRDTNLDSTVTIEQATDGTDGGIRIYGSNSNSIRGQMYYDGTQSFVIHGTSGPSGEYSTLRFATGLYNNPQIRMSINKDNGFVGIGTTTPSTGLEISGSGNTSRIKLINGSNQLNLGLWDGSNYRMEGDANRPILLTSYHSDGIKLGGSGATNLQIKAGRVTSPTDPAISFNPTGVSSGTGFKLYEQAAPWAENGGSAWPVMQTSVFTVHMNGTLRIRANMYIQSGSYYFKWRIKNQMSGAVLWDSSSDGGQAFAGYEYPAGQSGNVHNPKYYVFDVPGFEAGQRYCLEMSPSNYAGSIEYTNSSQNLYLKEFSVYAEGTQMSSQTIPRGKVPRYNTPTPANNSSTGAVLSQASGLSTHISLGVHEKYLGSVQFRAYASYLDFRTNLNSNSYMFYMICTGYLYNDGVFNHAMRGGYMYTNNSVINQQASTPSGSDAWYHFYRDGSGRLCGKLNKGQNAYTEGKVHLYIGTFDSNDQNVYITDVCMNNTTSNIF